VAPIKDEISNDETSENTMNVEEDEPSVPSEPVKVLKKRGRKRKVVPPPPPPPPENEEEVKEETDESRCKKIKVTQKFLENYGPQLDYSFKLWTENSKVLNEATVHDMDLSKNPLRWTVDEVCMFLVKFCDEKLTAKFYAEKIDGEALLSLSQKDLITLMEIKVGPAIKIYNRILYLRQEVMTKFTRI
jgi:lethal(3)malignant brain tumor-like protein